MDARSRYPGSMDFDWVHNWALACGCIRGALSESGIDPKRLPPSAPPACADRLYDKDGREIWACANIGTRNNDEVGQLIAMNPELEKGEVYTLSGETTALGARCCSLGEKQTASSGANRSQKSACSMTG